MPLESDARQRFFLLTCRDPKTDFRLPLAEALKAEFDVWTIWLRRKPLVISPAGEKRVLTLVGLVRWLRGMGAAGGRAVYFNSTNTSFPIFTACLRLIAPRGVWCLDMHDDLRYHYRGFQRVRAMAAIKIMRAFSHVTVHAAGSLAELFPDSRPLGNASHLTRAARDPALPMQVLVIASLDQRFDFELMEKTAALMPSVPFHIHGQISGNDAAIRRQLDDLIRRRENIAYHGAYISDDLPVLMQSYAVSFAPYRTDTELTRYIDPLRYYHCLNSGVEVVTTAIPQALTMRDALHIAHTPAEAAQALSLLLKHENSKLADYRPVTWVHRAERLATILREVGAA